MWTPSFMEILSLVDCDFGWYFPFFSFWGVVDTLHFQAWICVLNRERNPNLPT